MSLEGDGPTDELYFLLWSKNPATRHGPAVFVPDTVIYKCGSPCAWYFTSSSSPALLRKNKHNLTSARIEEAFAKQAGTDVVAAWWTLPNVFVEEEAASLYRKLEQQDGVRGGGGGSSIEYLDKAGLHEFLFRRRKDCGILQRFVEPKGPRNAVIRAIWSPKVCVVERRTNRHGIHDRRFGLYERAVTYDGPDHHSEATPLRGTLLVGKLERVCQELAAHVAAVTGQRQRIARCVLNFKVDAQDRIHFLFSSSIRLQQAADADEGSAASSDARRLAAGLSSPRLLHHALDLGPQLRVPRGMRLADAPSHSVQQPRPTPLVPCPGCGAHIPSDCLYPLPYPSVGARHDARRPPSSASPRGTDDSDDHAPPLIRRLHPTLTSSREAYARLCADPLFAGQTARVCDDCFLLHTTN